MICDNIKEQFAQLKRDTDCEVYAVQVFGPDHVLALVIPPGARGKETINPMNVAGESAPLEALETTLGDWNEVRRPILTLFTRRAEPALRVVPADEPVH
jgi:hypothetical protein